MAPKPRAPHKPESGVSLGPLEDAVGYHIAQAAVETDASFERHVGQPFGLRKVEYSLLMLLKANGALPRARLSDWDRCASGFPYPRRPAQTALPGFRRTGHAAIQRALRTRTETRAPGLSAPQSARESCSLA
jgi:hypothetical protein